jgi:predicted branched-subunit amino acid permease
LFFFSVWNVAVPVGMLVGPIVPPEWRLDFAPAIMFAGLTLFAINRVPAGVGARVGGLASLMAAGRRDRLGIVSGATAGVIAGAVAEHFVNNNDDGTGLDTSDVVVGR